ncbi:hypothetical protein FCS83_00780 [Oenococcus sp. UCMA 17063]|mgnify:CR=1 FL=1|nr:hypothetical protein [Oenococcus sp. UCMA 17063]
MPLLEAFSLIFAIFAALFCLSYALLKKDRRHKLIALAIVLISMIILIISVSISGTKTKFAGITFNKEKIASIKGIIEKEKILSKDLVNSDSNVKNNQSKINSDKKSLNLSCKEVSGQNLRDEQITDLLSVQGLTTKYEKTCMMRYFINEEINKSIAYSMKNISKKQAEEISATMTYGVFGY